MTLHETLPRQHVAEEMNVNEFTAGRIKTVVVADTGRVVTPADRSRLETQL